MSVTALYHPARTRSVEKYLSPKEEVRYVTRRHVKVLDAATGIWLVALAFYLGSAAAASGSAGDLPLTRIGFAAFAAATGYLLWKWAEWSTTRYVFTTERVVLVDGVLARKVNGIPMRLVIDTVYRQPLAGRLLGYGHLELNLSGKPGLRTLTFLPDLDTAYKIVLILARGHEVPPDEDVDDDTGWGPPSPAGTRPLVPLPGGST